MSRMQRRLGAVGLAAAVVGAIAVPQADASATAASDSATLYVNNTSSTCTDSGTGTESAPYCSLQAAADAATAGDTVDVSGSPGFYGTPYGSVTIANSGTASAPITFVGTGNTYAQLGSLTVNGSYIDVDGLYASITTGAAIAVNGSNVTLDHDQAYAFGGPALQLGDSVSAVTVEQSFLSGDFTNPETASEVVRTGSGDTGFVLSTDEIDDLSGGSTTSTTPMVGLDGTKNAEIASNTFLSGCQSGVGVTGSTGTSIENNVFGGTGACPSDDPADLSVDAASASSTTADYNELSQMSSSVDPYSWAGKAYATQSAFNSATGQGAHDETEQYIDPTTDTEPTGDGVADGNANAPGELTTDLYGNTWPGAAPDRGAVAVEEYTGASLYASPIDAQQVGLTLDLKGVAWGSSNTFSVNWGDGQTDSGISFGESIPENFSDLNDTHMYATPGTYTITVTATDAAQTVTRTTTVTTTGSTFVPVTPTRILDTRDGTGVTQGQVGPGGTISVGVTDGVSGAPSGTITAVVMNVTTTNATAPGFVTVYPDGSALPSSSNLNYAKSETVPNLVTVKVGADGKVALHNTSTGSTDLIADVEGYYVQGASGALYEANSPQRLLDTRAGTGAPKAAVGPGGTISLSVPGCSVTSGGTTSTVPATAVAMNVTVTQPSSAGFVTVYPDDSGVPTASNVNYAGGETVANLVVVKVGSDGKVDFHNTSTGTVQIIGDLEGCYSASAGGAFVPLNPTRELDTRSGLGEGSTTGTPAPANGNAAWDYPPAPMNGLWGMTAVVLNVTVTQPKANGFITAYPGGGGSVPNASNLNFSAGETVPNLVMVASDGGPFVDLHNSSTGTTELVADLFGYFS